MTTPNPSGQATPAPNASGNPSPGQGAAGTPPPAVPGGAPGTGTPAPEGPKTVPITALHEERDKRQQAEADKVTLMAEIQHLKEIMQSGTPIQQPGVAPAPTFQPPMPQEDMRARLDKMWEEDPRSAFQTEMQIAFSWRDWVDSNVEYQIDKSRETHSDFRDYEPSVRRYVRALPLEERAKPNISEAAYYMVRGQKVEDIIKSREQLLLDKIRRGEAIQGFNAGTFTPPPAQPAAITEQERAAAAAMGITAEEYMKYRKP